MNCKKCILLILLTLLLGASICGCGTALSEGEISEPSEKKTNEQSEKTSEMIDGVRIKFDYSRMSTHASNQMAIWVEDEAGSLVKTVLVTDFTAVRRGYRNRDMTLPSWVETADPENITDDEIDAISSATPSPGSRTYIWDMTDENGERVPDGRYTVKLEGTLFWESNVLFSTEFDTVAEENELEVTELRSEPDDPENEEMIRNVRMEVIRVSN